jgi:hypothetical protein
MDQWQYVAALYTMLQTRHIQSPGFGIEGGTDRIATSNLNDGRMDLQDQVRHYRWICGCEQQAMLSASCLPPPLALGSSR